MTRRTSSPAPLGGGIALAIGPILGAVIGASRGQPSAGVVIGFVAGLGFAVTLWLLDRRK